ncbi:MAG TPA: ubiquinol-cytochrome c reductase iron-sulfur subunit [Actinomycetota bacterium]
MADDEPRTEGLQGAQEDGVDRRQFLNWSWKVLGAALVVEAGWTSYDLLNPGQAGGFGGIVDAGSVSDYLQEGTVQYFLDGRFYVTQYQGGLRALYQKCPHLGCRVPYCSDSQRFECPCHGSVYNIIGEYVTGPAPRGMDRFPLKIEGDRVLVDTSSLVLGPNRGSLTGPSQAAGPSCLGESVSGSAAATPEATP